MYARKESSSRGLWRQISLLNFHLLLRHELPQTFDSLPSTLLRMGGPVSRLFWREWGGSCIDFRQTLVQPTAWVPLTWVLCLIVFKWLLHFRKRYVVSMEFSPLFRSLNAPRSMLHNRLLDITVKLGCVSSVLSDGSQVVHADHTCVQVVTAGRRVHVLLQLTYRQRRRFNSLKREQLRTYGDLNRNKKFSI